MADQYLTVQQVCESLGISQNDVREMVADGRLREFRQGDTLLYSAEDVDRLHSMQGSSIVDLAMTDDAVASDHPDTYAAALSSLADSSSDLGLLDDSRTPGQAGMPGFDSTADIELAALPEELPAAPAKGQPKGKGSPPRKKSDELSSEIGLLPSDEEAATAGATPAANLPSDVDLSASDSYVISLETTEEKITAKKAKDDTRITSAGISVFDDDELDIDSDPMAKTHVPGAGDEVGAGGGSGLLDLTRESDDTSLGAELLDVISPTEAEETEAAATVDDDAEVAAVADDEPQAMDEDLVPAAAPAVRRTAAVGMAGAVPMNLCILLGLLSLAVIGLVTASSIQGVWPDFISTVSRDVVHWSVFGGAALLAIVTGVLAIVADSK